MLKCQHFPINTLAYMDPKISISVNIAKWHSGSKRSRDSGVFRHTLLLGQVKHFGTALNTQSLHNAQMETDMGGGEWVKRGWRRGPMNIAKSK